MSGTFGHSPNESFQHSKLKIDIAETVGGESAAMWASIRTWKNKSLSQKKKFFWGGAFD